MSRVLAILVVSLAAVAAFAPARFGARTTAQLQMSADNKIMKFLGAGLLAANLFGTPAFAVDGAAPKQSYFGGGTSSPFPLEEKREDNFYSPYSPYGDGSAAAYNGRKGGKEEIAFWSKTLDIATKRVDNVPKFVGPGRWLDIDTELTSYAYNTREALLRLSKISTNPVAAEKIAKSYFSDLEDISLGARKKDRAAVTAAYEKSTADLAAFKALL